MERSRQYSTSFFFQAEDGIRDIGVTGVQTCALPIWTQLDGLRELLAGLLILAARGVGAAQLVVSDRVLGRRSEERRVGKECRSRGWAGHVKMYGELVVYNDEDDRVNSHDVSADKQEI